MQETNDTEPTTKAGTPVTIETCWLTLYKKE
jgi:hypothetical protein